MTVTIRPYRHATDKEALYDICVRTADAGEDSRELYPDLDLMPSIFAAPYVHLEPGFAFVADDGGQAVGYIVGCADTPAFVRAYREEWLPKLIDRYPPPEHPPATPSEEMVALMHDPERMILPEVAAYPAHLHMNLLPGYQRAGHGRALMTTLCRALAAGGVPALHLCMLTANTRARAFYDRVGFHVIDVPDPGPVTYLGRSTDM
ncbi:GNAT family N-acetyltransferase [Actinomadura sp. ATCC 31491]|uniref:GNAT family N-acetyltransferase n=1 Tax=Actinomadura luzonensis TaxID=2805427 RepID=A0ABT0G8N0_9ACTN|nr:GNAT family N-acetyltransferase [Actinomadura luzonensis]MCK2220958.1 GNAT family N-acetyltransferase [Actinomadura luzonensis]